MKEKLEAIIKKLREISAEIGKVENQFEGAAHSQAEDNMDAATESIQDAIDELEEIIPRL